MEKPVSFPTGFSCVYLIFFRPTFFKFPNLSEGENCLCLSITSTSAKFEYLRVITSVE